MRRIVHLVERKHTSNRALWNVMKGADAKGITITFIVLVVGPNQLSVAVLAECKNRKKERERSD